MCVKQISFSAKRCDEQSLVNTLNMKIKFRTDSKLNILGSIQRALALAETKTESNWDKLSSEIDSDSVPEHTFTYKKET